MDSFSKSAMRFVLLDHRPADGNNRSASRTRQRHFDLMLDVSDPAGLITFAFESMPQIESPVSFVKLAHHREEYLHYEGPISGNRGEVSRVGLGEFTASDIAAVVAGEGRVKLKFDPTSPQFAQEWWDLEFCRGMLIRHRPTSKN